MSTTYAPKQAPAQKKDAPTASSVLDNSPQSESLQRKADMTNNAAQRAEAPRPNNTGMPDNLKSGIESLSGFSMDDVRVHYNSSKPATVQALAYTQGTDIHVAPGQEKHLPHEAWHVAQQMAGRVSPTTNINGMPVNDNAGLEHEADVMGEKAIQRKRTNHPIITGTQLNHSIIQKEDRLTRSYTKTAGRSGPIYIPDMLIIDSTSPSTYVHLSRNPTGEEKKIPGNSREIYKSGNKFASRTTNQASITEAKKHFTTENNAHITLEGRYKRIMVNLVQGQNVDLDATKTGAPTDGTYQNLNYKYSFNNEEKKSSNSIIEQINKTAQEAKDNVEKGVDANKNYTPISKKIKRQNRIIIERVKNDTLAYATTLINTLKKPSKGKNEKNDPKLIHYNGNPW